MGLGISFVPGQGPDQQRPQQAPTDSAPLQQALQMLSLRLPRFTSASAILPPQLQQRQPGAPLPPQPGTPEWEELMRRLLSGGGAPSPGGQQPPPPIPAPGWKYNPPPGPPQHGERAPGFGAPPFPTIGQIPGAIPNRDIVPDQKQY